MDTLAMQVGNEHLTSAFSLGDKVCVWCGGGQRGGGAESKGEQQVDTKFWATAVQTQG